MDKDKAAEELKTIRQLMERPIRYSTMSGLSGILAGCAALVGVWLDRDFSTRFSGGTALVALMCLWSGVFLAALAATLVLTRLREKARGMPFWSPVKRKILRAILPPFIAAIGLTLAIILRYWFEAMWAAKFEMEFDAESYWASIYQGYLIPAVWMLFYGVTLWQVGEFSLGEVGRWACCSSWRAS